MKIQIPLINIVFGCEIKKDGSNIIQNFNSLVVPRIGETILTSKVGRVTVNDIIIDYRQIDEGASGGGPIIWVFV